jgi:protein-disulfide isomerase
LSDVPILEKEAPNLVQFDFEIHVAKKFNTYYNTTTMEHKIHEKSGQYEVEENPKIKRDYLLPVSILIAAVMVSVSLVYNTGKKASGPENKPADSVPQAAAPSPESMKPISDQDHVRGDINAPVKIVEYSDLECPFCKVFHETTNEILAAYGNKVVLIYRHLPLVQLHPKAQKEAEASECAANLGGNDAFWAFVDQVFKVTPSNNGLDPAELPKIAAGIGLNQADFEKCLSSGGGADAVKADIQDAQNIGIGGTPYMIIIGKDGRKNVIPGALPFKDTAQGPGMKTIIDTLLK